MSKKTSGAWAVCDCETDAFDGEAVRPFVWAIITSTGDKHIFWETSAFIAYIKNFYGLLYAHNGGKFDFLMPGVVEHLNHGEIMLINSRLAKAYIGKCELRDSWLIIPSPLADGGDKLEFDYSLFGRNKKKHRIEHKAKIEEYVMQDVIALYKLVERFRAVHGDALTLPGACMKAWEKMGGNPRRYGKEHDEFARPFYFGGRCEALEYGAPLAGDFEYYDIVSSYPRAMMERHPLGIDYSTSTDYISAPGASFWRVEAESYGAFPLRTKNGLYFPRDGVRREYHVTGWELLAALETKTADIYCAFGYIPKYFESLAPYVNKFFTDKEDAEKRSDKVDRLLAKLALNSLYGKFAANPENYKDYLLVAPGVRFVNMQTTPKLFGYLPDIDGDGYDILSKPTENAQYFDVALGASITGFARAALWRAMCASDGVVYCDTDSIIALKFNGATGTKLGEWKKEADLSQLHIAGKKLYCGYDKSANVWKAAHKGFSKLDTEIEDIKKAARGEFVEITRSAPSINISGAQVFIKRKMRIT